MKNTFALVNKTPPGVLFLIPNYWEDSDRDEGLIKLTHVCRGWREIFTSYPLLWTRLDCMNIEKTKTYIERSKSSPLEISLGQVGDMSYREEAFILAATHVSRLRTLSIIGLSPTHDLPALAEHLSLPAPLLDRLNIDLICDQTPILPDGLFNGDLSSLRELCLAGVITPLPWRGLSNLTTFKLCRVPGDQILLTQLLDFFESTPHLRLIRLHDSIPNSSNVPAERVVSLPHLKEFNIIAQTPHSVLLNHLSIPAGASLRLEFTFSGRESPVTSYLPKSLDNLDNLSNITATNLCLGSAQRSVRFNGPSGDLYIIGNRTGGGAQPHAGTGRFLESLGRFYNSRNQWLAISLCGYQAGAPGRVTTYFRMLRSMENLRTLMLSQCHNLLFILILNPSKNTDGFVLCPKLEDIIFYIKHPDQLHLDELLSMAEGRASSGVRLAGITIVSTEALAPIKEVFQLRKHASRVEYKFDNAPPAWDALPTMQMVIGVRAVCGAEV